jgi:hypothetical protein
MKTHRLALLALLALLPLGAAHAAEPVGKIDDWTGGATPLHMMRSDAEVGRIDADGTIHLALPTPPASRQTAARTFARCEGLEVSGGEVTVAPAMFFIDTGAGENYLFPATSAAVADWQASFGETPLAEGAWLQWIHATGEARITGSCRQAIHTGASGETPAFEERVDYDVTLAPGWNRIRQGIDKVYADTDGMRYVERQSVRSVDAMPVDIRWFPERR